MWMANSFKAAKQTHECSRNWLLHRIETAFTSYIQQFKFIQIHYKKIKTFISFQLSSDKLLHTDAFIETVCLNRYLEIAKNIFKEQQKHFLLQLY